MRSSSVYANNPGKLAAWLSASHVEKAPKKKTPPTPSMSRSRRLLTIVLIAMSGALMACSTKQLAANSQPRPNATVPADDPDADRIKPEGWPLPGLQRGKVYRQTVKEKQEDGTTLDVVEINYSPKNRPKADLPDTDRETWIIWDVTEFRYRSSRPFCYAFKASPVPKDGSNGVAISTHYRLCDKDGDGLYETRGGTFASAFVPAWAKNN